MFRIQTIIVLTVATWLAGFSPLANPLRAATPTKLLSSLPDSNGNTTNLGWSDDDRLRVICFLGCECPLAKLYGPRLKTLHDDFQSQGVKFVGINSNPQDSLTDIAAYVKSLEIPFPVLKDYDQVALKTLDAKRTPEVIVFDSRGQEIYRGRIDDQYEPGLSRQKPNHHDLRAAIEEHLAGKPISTPRTESVGCLIARRQKPEKQDSQAEGSVTYCNQIVRLLHRHCVECHRPGEIGPFSLTEYDEVVGWADMMLETIEQRRMPPWNANPEHGDFANARHMPDADRKLLQQWIESGTPFGDSKELATQPEYASSPSTHAPFDLEIPMQEEPYEVAAEGTIEYQYFVVDPHFEEDRWVRIAQLTPSNRSVVHHGIVFVRPPAGVALNGIGWLSAYVPGQIPLESPEHRAQRIPAGSKLVFQMHYTPNGRPEKDKTTLRLTFADPALVTEERISLISLNQDLEIPPGNESVPISGRISRLPASGKLLALSPHMHLRGKSMRVEVTSKSSSDRQVLLDVPAYDFNWQHTYVLRDPIPLHSVQELSFLATFDNSSNNRFNPDPTAFVTWGDQTWEEMAIVYYDVAIPLANENRSDAKMPVAKKKPKDVEKNSKRVSELVDQLFQDLDRDRDGKIEYQEVDQAVQIKGFRLYDLNRDRIIDRPEATEAISRSAP